VTGTALSKSLLELTFESCGQRLKYAAARVLKRLVGRVHDRIGDDDLCLLFDRIVPDGSLGLI
jgi:hypothetical protein